MRELWRRLRHGRDAGARARREIRFHIDQQTEKNIRAGMTPEEARRQAFVRFGGVEYLKEQTRDEFRPALLEDFLRDVRYGVRLLLRAQGLRHRRHPDARPRHRRRHRGLQRRRRRAAAAAALSRIPIASSGCYQVDGNGRRTNTVSEPNFEDWKSGTRSFSAMAEMSAGPTPVSIGGEAIDDARRRRLARVLRRDGRAAARRTRLPARGAARRRRAGGDRQRSPVAHAARAARRSTR